MRPASWLAKIVLGALCLGAMLAYGLMVPDDWSGHRLLAMLFVYVVALGIFAMLEQDTRP